MSFCHSSDVWDLNSVQMRTSQPVLGWPVKNGTLALVFCNQYCPQICQITSRLKKITDLLIEVWTNENYQANSAYVELLYQKRSRCINNGLIGYQTPHESILAIFFHICFGFDNPCQYYQTCQRNFVVYWPLKAGLQ